MSEKLQYQVISMECSKEFLHVNFVKILYSKESKMRIASLPKKCRMRRENLPDGARYDMINKETIPSKERYV